MSFLEDIALGAFKAVAGASAVNKILINKLVNRSPARPHPWSTRHDYISWSGLTDHSYSARLLPAKPYPAADAPGTRRPPLADVAQLFVAAPGGQRVCGKSTCLFPAFAQYLTDGFLRTMVSNPPHYGPGVEDRRRTTSNHEIDLSPLYGRTEAQTRVLRALTGGRLKTQTINGEPFPPFLYGPDRLVKAEFCDPGGTPILDQPLGAGDATLHLDTLFAVGGDRANANPQVAMMNILFLREHNRLAAMLQAQHPAWDDDRLFETARNIVIVMFIKMVVEEYINHINTANFRFLADGKVAWEAKWNRPNFMTAEFSLLYRWHSLVPETMTWGGQSVPLATMLLNNTGLIADGLANAFVETSANHAAQLGLQNSASFLLRAEQKAVDQARTNNIATYNDYRRAMQLDPAKSFAELVGKSKDAAEQARRTALAARLEQLYGNIDNVEFYVGLFAEPHGANGPLPDLILAMVAIDAFSQALTNPLLSEQVWEQREAAFTAAGLAEIDKTRTLRDILARNSTGLADRFVGMTRQDWKRS